MEQTSSPGSAAGRDRWLATGAGLLVLSIAAAKLAVHLYAGRHYGYFVDELYYLACSRHLDWGYVDQPPLIAAITWLTRVLLGDSLPAIRFFPAVAGAAKVLLTALIARELGGGRFAQALAALAVLVAPGFLAIDALLTMNAFEALLWTACAYVVVRILKTGNQRLWIWFGILAGMGLENKHSMLIFGAALTVGLLLTPQRRVFREPWIWIGGVLAFLIFLPNLIWNIQHHFPFLELQANIRRSGRNVDLTPLAFFGQEVLIMLPLSLPIWLAGLWFYLRTRAFRALGWAWLITAAVIMVLNPRVYYLWPAFPILFAAGGVAWESWLAKPRWSWVRIAWPALMVLFGVVAAPFVIPVLPAETYIRYAEALHYQQPAIETHKLGPLPQLFADQFGWEEMAATVARVYNGLPPDVRARTAIFGQNYGQAGAIDLFGPRYGLPHAISGHQNYFLWGPGSFNGDSIIVMAGRQKDLERLYHSVQKVAHVSHPYSMPYEHFDVFYCRGLRGSLKELWPQVKTWD
ncbi:MAG TPA: glycosyltransferase family 39 protein [Bryobacteraceae bacterium]|nr:glycosyltransferase family 39 protein [Bryobacteraceae bacterium]